MRFFTAFVHFLLLFTVPTFLLFPHAEMSPNIRTPETAKDYDALLGLIDELESGELEKRCSLADLEILCLISLLKLIYRLKNLFIEGINFEN